MSYSVSNLPPCENVQVALNQVFSKCGGAGIINERLPILAFLTSAQNTGLLQQVIAPGQGKVKTVQIIGTQRAALSEVNTNVANKCDATGSPGAYVIDECKIDPDNNIHTEWVINKEDLAHACTTSNNDYIYETINSRIELLERKIEIDLATELAALLGQWGSAAAHQAGALVGTAADLEVSTLVGGNVENLSSLPYHTIDTASMLTGYCDNKLILSGADLYSYFQRSAFGGCCTSGGQNLKDIWSQFGIATTYSRELEKIIGRDKAIITQPGALQLITYTRTQWTEGMDNGFHGHSYYDRLVQSPKYRIPMDLTVKDDCGKLQFNLYANVSLKAMPTSIFEGDADYEGVNFVNGIQVI